MSVADQMHLSGRRNFWFRAFKYTVYLLLAYNVVLFFREDLAASQAMFSDGVSWPNLVEAFSATFDTAAWVVLLLLFELETAVIPDEWLKGRLKWLLIAVRAFCYAFITWALWGYWVKLGVILNVQPFLSADVCGLLGTDAAWLVDLDEYPPVDAAACEASKGQPLVQVAGTQIISTAQAAKAAAGLAIVDVINALDWLLIVIMLEVEVLLQLWDRLSDRLIGMFKWIKGVLYSILFAAAVYWGFLGDFLDFWDAFLWLVAFIFIELNLFQWHNEIEEEKELREASGSA